MLNKDTSRTLTDKWNPILEGIDDSSTRESTAVLLENQARSIMNEMTKDGNSLNESTGVGSLGTFQKFAFPLIRRVFPELIANKICGVQPMQAPVSQVFYLGYSRTGNNNAGNARTETVYSRYNLTYRGLDAAKNADGGWGATSSLDAQIIAGGPYDGMGAVNQGLSGNTIAANDTVGGKIAAFPNETKTYALDVSTGEALTGAAIPEINFHIEQQAVIARTRKFRALWTLEAAQDLRAYHNLDLERELTDLLGKEVSLEIDRELLEDIRGLAYDWTANDGWNRDMLSMGNSNNFGDDGTGNFNPSGFYYDLNQDTHDPFLGTDPKGVRRTAGNIFLVDFASSALGLDPRHVGQVYSNLVAALNFASQDIYKTTYRGAGNWIVTSPMVAAILSSASKMEGGVRQGEFDGALGANIQYKGKLMGQFDVYVDPLWPEDEIMMGYKGSSPMDSGYIYSPYIPLQMLPTITDPDTFQPRKGLLTRYGKTAVSPESRFYRIIRLMGATSNFMTQPFATVKGS
tara:strand:+ start:4386 stop:5936 length:1551 start_codon:yes stop_codon:yes gene_type:complete